MDTKELIGDLDIARAGAKRPVAGRMLYSG